MRVIVQVQSRGSLTLPAELRDKYDIREGDILQLVDLDGLFVLSPVEAIAPDLAREIEAARLEAGFTTEELLAALREKRERYSP